MSRPPDAKRVPAHEHLCPVRGHGWYWCGLLTARCPLKLKTVAECPMCAKLEELEERRKVERGRRFWNPPQPRAGG